MTNEQRYNQVLSGMLILANECIEQQTHIKYELNEGSIDLKYVAEPAAVTINMYLGGLFMAEHHPITDADPKQQIAHAATRIAMDLYAKAVRRQRK